MPGVKNTSNIALIAISASTITYSFAEVKAQGKGYFFFVITWQSKEEYIINLKLYEI